MEAGPDIICDSCAVFGCASSKDNKECVDVKDILYLGLSALQHRGQESSGMVLFNGHRMLVKKGMGLVGNVFAEMPSDFTGHMGLGHNRYSTAGDSSLLHCQPFVVHTIHGQIALAHNGELVNARQLRSVLLKKGVGLSSESDSELMTQLLVCEPPCGEPNGPDWSARIASLMSLAQCSYSCIVMTAQGELYAFRDPFGNRPLCLGEFAVNPPGKLESPLDSPDEVIPKKRKGENRVFIVSSESCAFASIGAEKIRDVLPGEIVKVTESGFQTVGLIPREDGKLPAFCIFEYVYFARADSVIQGNLVHAARRQCGRQLAIEAPVFADVVSTIPDSASPAAMGFSEISGIPYNEVVVKNRYTGRTFIQPSDFLRKRAIVKKFGPLTKNIAGKRVVIIDDSIVRGNTMPYIVDLLRTAGATEVHLRIASPPLKHPCFMGINIPTKDELIANHYAAEELATKFKADSLVYLSVDGLKKAIESGIIEKDKTNVGHCTACLTGEYPVALDW